MKQGVAVGDVYRTLQAYLGGLYLNQFNRSGQATAALEEVARQTRPPEIGYDWADLSYQERKASGTTASVFGLSLVFVFLILAALYESWTLPFSVLLTVPVAVFGAFLGL